MTRDDGRRVEKIEPIAKMGRHDVSRYKLPTTKEKLCWVREKKR